MTKSEFIDWKRHPVTQQVFAQLEGRVAEITEELIFSAGKDSVMDAERAALIKAYRDLILIDYEESQ